MVFLEAGVTVANSTVTARHTLPGRRESIFRPVPPRFCSNERVLGYYRTPHDCTWKMSPAPTPFYCFASVTEYSRPNDPRLHLLREKDDSQLLREFGSHRRGSVTTADTLLPTASYPPVRSTHRVDLEGSRMFGCYQTNRTNKRWLEFNATRNCSERVSFVPREAISFSKGPTHLPQQKNIPSPRLELILHTTDLSPTGWACHPWTTAVPETAASLPFKAIIPLNTPRMTPAPQGA